MLNPELDDFVSSELLAIGQEAAASGTTSALPPRLYYRADAHALDALLHAGTMRAWHSRLAASFAVAPYGIGFAEKWLLDKRDACQPGLRQDFCNAVIHGLNPRGTHFDCFLARLFARPVAPVASSSAPAFAVAIRCPDLPWSASGEPSASVLLQPAISSETIQARMIEALYTRYERYFLHCVDRFGDRNARELMMRCLDALRRELGALLMRFRKPVAVADEEWIAIALGQASRSEDTVYVDVVDGQFAPSVMISLCTHAPGQRPRLAINEITVAPHLPFETTRETLQARLQAGKSYTMTRAPIRIVPAL